jgi:CrcB protein
MRTEIELLLIGLGGALGAMSRYSITALSNKVFAHTFPLGTLIANLLGCFLLGMILGSGHAEKSHPIRLGVGVGFLGALTTFSTFGAETMSHANEGNWTIAFGNVLANVVLGLLFVFLGMMAGKKLA